MEITRILPLELEGKNLFELLEQGTINLSIIALQKLFYIDINTPPFILDDASSLEQGYFLPLVEIKFGLRCDGGYDATLIAKARVLMSEYPTKDILEPKTL